MIVCDCPRNDCCRACYDQALIWFGGMAYALRCTGATPGRYGTIGHTIETGRSAPRDFAPLIAKDACVRAYPSRAPWRVMLVVETTLDEVVDVTIGEGQGALAECLVEAAWAVRLDARFDRERDAFHGRAVRTVTNVAACRVWRCAVAWRCAARVTRSRV
jgi:hypothetical protein